MQALVSTSEQNEQDGWATRLLRVLHGATKSAGFLMLKAYKSYMDETGVMHRNRYCTISGYVMKAEAWDEFDRQWRFVLGEYMRDVPEEKRYFHALEFYESDGVFSRWRRGKKDSFINALFSVIHTLDPALFSSTVDTEVFRSLTEDERKYLTGGIHTGMKWRTHGAPTKPYFLPFQHCIIQGADLVPDDGLVYPVMSRQDQFEMRALELYDEMLNSDPPLRCRKKLADDMVFSNPKKVPGLQAADLAAYWLGQWATYVEKTGDWRHERGQHQDQMQTVLRNARELDDLKLFNFQGLMMVLMGASRYLKTSFPTLDQMLPSLPIARRKEILGMMRKADFRPFLDHWPLDVLASHG